MFNACKKETVNYDNFYAIQGIWVNKTDTFKFYKPVLYVFSDTLRAACSYKVYDNTLIISYIQHRYQYNIIYIDCNTLILNNIKFRKL